MPMVPIDQLSGPQFGTVAIVGAPFTGKTESLKTLHKFLLKQGLCPRIALFDLDNNAQSLIRIAQLEKWTADLEVYRYSGLSSRIGDKETPNRSKIPSERFINDFSSIYDRLDSQTGLWKEGIDPKTSRPYALGAVVVDSVTALTERWKDFVFSIRQKEVGGTVAEGKNVSFSEWEMIKLKTLETVRSAKGLPCYSVFMFHEVLLQEEVSGPNPADTKTTGAFYWVPLVTGNLSTTIQKEFSVVVHTRVEGDRFEWITRNEDRIRSVGTRNRELLKGRVTQDFAEILAT